METQTIAVLMTCYNRVETTLRALRALFGCDRPEGWELEVWLVDDGSPDGTGARVRAEFPGVHVIDGTGDLFWCKGMRLAWDRAAAAKDFDAYLWLNDDVTLSPDALRTLADDVVRTGGESILFGALQDRAGAVVYGLATERGLVRPTGAPLETRGQMSGNFVYVPRAAFRRLGPIYGGYSHGFGDYDYGWLADRRGVRRYLCSRVVGVCSPEPERYRHVTGEPLARRIRALFDRKGFPLRDNFIYRYRQGGALLAVLSTAHVVWLRVVRARG